jgi:rod shape-determining protein MreB
MAAAIGAGLPVHDATASLVVDVGGGTTEVAVISLGGIVNARSLRVGGDEVDEAIVTGVRSAHELLLGERSAQEIKLTIGSAYPLTEELEMRVRGRDVGTGLPRTVTLSSTEVRRMIEPALLQIVDVVKAVLDVCPPELAGDVLDHGVVLTGGGAQLRGIEERLHRELGVPVRVADDPARAVIRGAGACVDDFAALEPFLVSPRRT